MPYSAFGKYYVRSADEDREMSQDVLKRYMNETSEDLITRVASFNQNLQFTQLKSLFLSRGLTINDETFESNLCLRNTSGQRSSNKFSRIL